MKRFFQANITLLILVVLPHVAAADTFENGLRAYIAGDYKSAQQIFFGEAMLGNPMAQNSLGVMYEKGQGVPQDDIEAVKWFLKAASQGEVLAQSYLGSHYAKGAGVPQNDKEAAKWFTMAAKQGDRFSQLSIGIMYDLGRGVAHNYIVAWAWYTLASENGVETAQSYIDSIQEKMSPDEIYLATQIAEMFRTEIGD